MSPRVGASINRGAQSINIRSILDRSVTIERGEEVTVLVQIDNDIINLDEVMFNPYKDMLAKRGILAANSIARVSKNGKIPVRLINTKDTRVTIFKQTKIGTIEPINERNAKYENIFRSFGGNETKHIECILHNIDEKVGSIEEKTSITKIIKEFKDVFSKDKNDIGHCSILKHEIDLMDNRPIAQPTRRAPLHLENKVDEMIIELEKHGIIRESSSPWSSPIVVCQKKSGDIRLCVDYRRLNSVTKRPIYPIPDSQQLFDSLAGAKYFSALDLSSGYYNLEINENDKQKTAFGTRRGQYEFNRLPFGLCGAPATFQRLMHLILREENFEKCVIYLDDILIYGRTINEHNERLRLVLNKIRQSGVKLSPTKCAFLRNSIKYLGHIISERGVETDPDKITAVTNWATPNSNEELQSFLGFCNYYRRFIHEYAKIVRPLEDLLRLANTNTRKKTIELKWEEVHTTAFNELKKVLSTTPILVFPTRDDTFILDTDASHYAMGAVLSQRQDNEERVISYGSKKFSKAEQMYCVTRKELLSVYYFVTKYKHYLLGKKFIIRTDHKSLTWMLNWRKPNTSQYCSWIAELEIYDFEIQHRHGKSHANADGLSRETSCEQCEVSHEDPKKKRNYKVVESHTKDVQEKNRQITSIQPETNLYDNEKINSTLSYFHNRLGHPNYAQTLLNVQKYHEWENMENDTKNFVQNCLPCAERKQGNQIGSNIKLAFTASEPFEMICVDITGPLPAANGYSYILGIIDVYSRYVSLIPMKDITAKTVADFILKRWIALFGVPKILHSDNGTQFKSDIINELCKRFQIKQSYSSPYYHEGNGLVERLFRTAKDKIYATCKSNKQNWTEVIPFVEMSMRSSTTRKYKISPFEILFGNQMNLDPTLKQEDIFVDKSIPQWRFDNRKEMIDNKRKMLPTATETNKHQETVKIGDLVMVKTNEIGMLKNRYSGPWKVINLLINNNVEIEMNNKRAKRNIHQLKKFKGDIIEKNNQSESIISATTTKRSTPINLKSTPVPEQEFERRFPLRERKANSKYADFSTI